MLDRVVRLAKPRHNEMGIFPVVVRVVDLDINDTAHVAGLGRQRAVTYERTCGHAHSLLMRIGSRAILLSVPCVRACPARGAAT